MDIKTVLKSINVIVNDAGCLHDDSDENIHGHTQLDVNTVEITPAPTDTSSMEHEERKNVMRRSMKRRKMLA